MDEEGDTVGIDIRMYAEVRIDGTWVALYRAHAEGLDELVRAADMGAEPTHEDRKALLDLDLHMTPVYCTRNYRLFHALTGDMSAWNVGEGIGEPVATMQDRIPSDASDDVALMWLTGPLQSDLGRCYTATKTQLDTIDLDEVFDHESIDAEMAWAWEDTMRLLDALGRPEDVRVHYWLTT